MTAPTTIAQISQALRQLHTHAKPPYNAWQLADALDAIDRAPQVNERLLAEIVRHAAYQISLLPTYHRIDDRAIQVIDNKEKHKDIIRAAIAAAQAAPQDGRKEWAMFYEKTAVDGEFREAYQTPDFEYVKNDAERRAKLGMKKSRIIERTIIEREVK